MPLLLKARGQGSSAVFGLMVALQAACGVVAAGSLSAVFAAGAAVALAAGGVLWLKGAWLEETLDRP